jgi:hypothetical protein
MPHFPSHSEGATPKSRSFAQPRCPSTTTRTESTFEEKASPLDLTQRIERKLAQYNASNNVLRRWSFEIVCWAVSASSLGAIIGIYIRIKDEPLSEWSTLLTLANTFGKVASAALIIPTTEALGQLKWNWFHESSQAMWDFEIFDKATRGPWGAVMLLYRTRGRSIAALGALLIILLLAIDSFLQQVVDYPERWAIQDDYGEVRRSVRYEPDYAPDYREGMELTMDDVDTKIVADKFLYGNGTQSLPLTRGSGNGTKADVPVVSYILPDLRAATNIVVDQSCPSSNCTWPAYDTLGVCSQCADMTEFLTHACVDNKIDWTYDLDGGYGVDGSWSNATVCGYFLNFTETPTFVSGYIINTQSSAKGDALVMRTIPMLDVMTKEPIYRNGSVLFAHIRNPITDFVIASAVDGTAASVYRNEAPVLQECVLFWCVKTIQSSYEGGIYKEDVIDIQLNTTSGPHPWSTYDVTTPYQNGTYIIYNDDIAITTDNGQTFGMSNGTVTNVMLLFDMFIPSFLTTRHNATDLILRYKTWMAGPAFSRTLQVNPWLAPNNVSAHMSRMATALTNQIRTVGSGNEDVRGIAYSQEVYIHVQWEWLIFPLILLILSLVFLIATIMKTSDGAMDIWKTSAIPTLIYGLPKEAQTQLDSSAHWNHNNPLTRKLRVKLSPRMGWRVSGQSWLNRSPVLPLRRNQPPPGWI